MRIRRASNPVGGGRRRPKPAPDGCILIGGADLPRYAPASGMSRTSRLRGDSNPTMSRDRLLFLSLSRAHAIGPRHICAAGLSRLSSVADFRFAMAFHFFVLRHHTAGPVPGCQPMPVFRYLYRCPLRNSLRRKIKGVWRDRPESNRRQQPFSRYTVVIAKALPTKLLSHGAGLSRLSS